MRLPPAACGKPPGASVHDGELIPDDSLSRGVVVEVLIGTGQVLAFLTK